MQIVLSEMDWESLKPDTRADLLRVLNRPARAAIGQDTRPSLDPAMEKDFDWENVAELPFKQIQTWVDGIHDKTKAGLRIIAEHGPVIDVKLLLKAGIDNLPHFQSRTTIRTRTVTGDKDAYLLAWDEWRYDQNGAVVSGRYAVTPITHQALRRYFGLD